jgi:hypothetical protein
MMARPTSYAEFWPFYVSQHLNGINRGLHIFGTSLMLVCVVASALHDPRWLMLAPVAGYGPAWIGHFVFERNRPATFSYPLWSLRGDFHMYALVLSGRMQPQLERARAWAAAHA